MSEHCLPTQFDCMKLDASLVENQPCDDVVFLVSLYNHLERECDAETDRLEEFADNISRRTDAAAQTSLGKRTPDSSWKTERKILSTLERANIATRFRVPYHIFGTGRAARGAKDLEFSQLETIELKIQNFMAQMEELEVEIATTIPKTLEGIVQKLNFFSGLCAEGSGFAVDIFAYVAEQSVQQLNEILDLQISKETA